MSTQNGADAESEEDDGPGRREVAHRVFAAEYDDATLSYQEGDEERAPTYVVTPSGAKANRLFLAGVLTEVEQVNDEMLRARIVDPTGAFVVYAGQYQPEARAAFERTSPPEFVAVAGKARTFQPEDGDRVFSSVRPESVNVVDADTRDRWAVETARATLRRVGAMADALRRGDPGDPTGGVALALEHYDTTPGYLAALRDLATDAAEVVADDRDEVRELDLAPGEDRPGADLAALAALLDAEALGGEPVAPSATDEPVTAGDTTTTGDDTAADADTTATTGDAGAAEEIEEIDADDDVAAFDDETETLADDLDTGDDLETDDDLDTGDDLETGDDDPETDDGDDLGDFDDDGVGDFEPGGGFDDGEGDGVGEVGDFEPGGIADEDDADEAAVDAGDAGDGEMYEMDEEERERIESEYGTEFSSGTEVDEPGAADIDTPDPEDLEAEEAEPAAPDVDEGDGETELDDADTEEAATEAVDAEDADEDAEEAVDADEEEPETELDEDEEKAEADEAEADEDTEVEEDEDEEGEAEDDGDTAADDAADVDGVLMEHMRELDDGDGADREALVEAVVEATGVDADSVEEAIQDALMSGQCYEPGEDRLKPI